MAYLIHLGATTQYTVRSFEKKKHINDFPTLLLSQAPFDFWPILVIHKNAACVTMKRATFKSSSVIGLIFFSASHIVDTFSHSWHETESVTKQEEQELK